MNFLEKLDALMSASGINKSRLSQLSGVPYTTIDGFYKKGYENAKISTIRKIAHTLDTSLDYLIEETPKEDTLSPEASAIGAAYDRADEKSRKMARLALEDFMETPIPATHRMDQSTIYVTPYVEDGRMMDPHLQENLCEWLKEHPNTSVSTGYVPEWVKFGMVQAGTTTGLPGWTKEEVRRRAERLFERPWTQRPNVIFTPEFDAEARRRGRQEKSARGFAESSGGKTECSSCAQCPLARRCSQRFSEKPFLGLRLGLQVVDGGGKKEPPAVLSDDECPLYNLLKRTAPKSASGEQILLDENGKPLLPAGDIDLRAVLSMMNPAFQSELAKALNPSGDNGDDSEKA